LALTQREVAGRAEVSERVVRKAERGGPLQASTIDALAVALQLPVEALVSPDGSTASAHAESGTEEPAGARRFREYLEGVWNQRDVSLVDQYLLPEFRFHTESGIVHGREEMARRVSGMLEAFSDIQFVVHHAEQHGDFVVGRWTFALTHTGPWLGIEPTGVRVTVYGSSWVQVVGDQFGDAWDFWDAEQLFHTLRGQDERDNDGHARS
jgi:predicted ester cyclase